MNARTHAPGLAGAARILVFNAGSSSLKFEVIEFSGDLPGRRVTAGNYAAVDGSGRFSGTAGGGASLPSAATLAEAAGLALDWLSDGAHHGRNLLDGLAATAHRIVHGGASFRGTTALGDRELAALAELNAVAPLHNPPALAVVDAVRARLGASLPLIGVFDTAYYADLPPSAYRYAVPGRWATEFGVRRYGFHGIAHRYLCERARSLHVGASGDLRVISLQLGRGCSVTATAGGRAIATSMGFTPLEGLVMGTRSGDIDAGAVLYVMERAGLTVEAMRRALNNDSGLAGLAGGTADMRELLELESAGDAGAALAVEIFCRRARHYVGGYLAELGGVDAIVFGGGIGENCPSIRARIVHGLEWSGIRLDVDRNTGAVGTESTLHAPDSRAGLYVASVNEAGIIAAEAFAALKAAPAR